MIWVAHIIAGMFFLPILPFTIIAHIILKKKGYL